MQKQWKTLSFLAGLLMAISAHAAGLGPIPVIDVITQWLIAPPAYVVMGVAFLWDMIRRLWPTFQPAGFLHDLGALICQIGTGLIALGKFADNLLPQNLSSKQQEK